MFSNLDAFYFLSLKLWYLQQKSKISKDAIKVSCEIKQDAKPGGHKDWFVKWNVKIRHIIQFSKIKNYIEEVIKTVLYSILE